ncbi:hypothetical protein CPB86DRAFT_562210 [Serendipita vermifera]|nr:hypothetical protein CPB86DRAFT_562210 [Serendipita vermifera]
MFCPTLFKRVAEHNAILRYKIGEYIQNSLPIRLLRVSDMSLDECLCFQDLKDELKFSILSHRWGPHELTFGDLQKLDTPLAEGKDSRLSGTRLEKMKATYKGTLYEDSLVKTIEFLRKSDQKQCKYGWADTLCINKESSAELDESIRSMYAWYRDSHICIVHLSETTHSENLEKDPWFTRGWTLQELLAPKRMMFFSKEWKQITTREGDKLQEKKSIEAKLEKHGEGSLWPRIAEITGIPIDDLLDFKPGLYDIGKRMSWASRRRTTRIEDMAYCLIGIFRVNLSISYGEKEGAFYRLQAEILQNTDDRTLFNWKGQASAYNSMFASSPEGFSGTQWGSSTPPVIFHNAKSTFASANFVLHIPLALHKMSELKSSLPDGVPKTAVFAILGPSFEPGKHFILALAPQEVGSVSQYKRLKVWSTEVAPKLLEKKPEDIIIK